MPGKMKSLCAGCGGEILFEKDATGQELIEAAPEQQALLCGTCAANGRGPKDEEADAGQGNADFEDEGHKAMRTGGREEPPAPKPW